MLGSVLSIGASLLGSGKGGSKTDVASAPQSGFATLPKAVQDAYLNTYLPDALKQYNTPRTPIPLVRADAPQSIFDSQELAKLQQFSDAIGGYFSPIDQPLQQTYNPQPAAPAEDPAKKARQANIDAARQWAASIVSQPKGGQSYDANAVRMRLNSLDDDRLAALGAHIEGMGGVSAAIRDAWRAGQPFGLM